MKRTLEPLIFEKGSHGRSGIDIAGSAQVGHTQERGAAQVGEARERGGAESGAHQREAFGIDASLLRDVLEDFPEVSEPEVIRHYVRLSQLNYSAATNFYPLGSCTMKYNPVANERAAALPGFANIHPYAPEEMVQGALRLLVDLEHKLCEISGLDAVSLQPAAGAQGELTGMKMVRAWHESQGRPRRKVLIPESAHGTNPASATLCGYDSVSVPCDARGLLSAAAVRERMDEDVAALMVTNPNTLGLFEEDIEEIASVVHEHGGLVYMDGANMNALMGVAKPGHMGADVLQFNLHKTFSTPHGGGGPGAGPVAVKSFLEKFLPRPRIVEKSGRLAWDHGCPDSIGKVRSFYGNFGILVRAWSYMTACGADGLTDTTRMAVLSANYLKAKLTPRYALAYDRPCMHEVVLTDKIQLRSGVKTLDIAKRLLDYGFHAPTIYFPLVVAGALMIEPTETESLETMDSFVEAMLSVADEAEHNPDKVREAPHETILARLDETRAARHPILTWQRRDAADKSVGAKP